jgi:hypothetical protein
VVTSREDKLRWSLLVMLLTTYLIHEAYSLFPDPVDPDLVFRPFILNPDQEVSLQYFVFAACEYLIWVIVFAVIHMLFVEARDVTIWFIVFQSLEVIEYFLTYNEAMIHIPLPGEDLGINITNIKIVVMFILVTKKYFTWNLGK